MLDHAADLGTVLLDDDVADPLEPEERSVSRWFCLQPIARPDLA